MNPFYDQVAQRAGHRCEYCHAPEAIFNVRFEVEHVIPPAAGGTNAVANLALACRSCNLYKSNHTSHSVANSDDAVALYNPRVDDWKSHFHVELATVEIQGITPNGRATVACLRMNSEAQLAARRQWARLGIFP